MRKSRGLKLTPRCCPPRSLAARQLVTPPGRGPQRGFQLRVCPRCRRVAVFVKTVDDCQRDEDWLWIGTFFALRGTISRYAGFVLDTAKSSSDGFGLIRAWVERHVRDCDSPQEAVASLTQFVQRVSIGGAAYAREL